MEESTEAHMETDLSSTTKDVADTQEVTGSYGNVEMVIVVEQVKEEETSSNILNEKQSSLVDEKINQVSLPEAMETKETVTHEVTETHKSPTKSPIKDVELKTSTKSPIIDEELKTSTKSPTKELNNPTKSSIKDAELKNPTKSPIKEVELKSPIKDAELKIPSKSPIEDAELNNPTMSPIKDAELKNPTKSPFQDAVLKNPKMSPIEDAELKNPTKSPIKDVEMVESVISQSEPELSQKDLNKELPMEVEIEVPVPPQQVVVADSSVKEIQIEIEENLKSVENSLDKLPKACEEDIVKKEAPKPVEVSPTKELQLNDLKTTLTKPILVRTPTKPTLVRTSPTKEQKTTPTKPTLVRPPPAKPILVRPSPTKPILVRSPPTKPTLVRSPPPKPILVRHSSLTEEKTIPTTEPLLVEKSPINGKVQSNEMTNHTTSKTIATVITVEGETCNDHELETNSMETCNPDLSEKEHNKSISRELKSLINSAKESKIISECTQLTSKTRKSRTLDSSLNTTVEADKINNRRNSATSQKSNCSEKSEKVAVKRSMRSQNPEFVSKVKQFLNSVTGKGHKDSDEEEEDAEEKVSKEKVVHKVSKEKIDRNDFISSPSPNKIKKIEYIVNIVPDKPGKLRADVFCWRCHWAVEQATSEKIHPPMNCTVCPRSFHYKCLSSTERNKINTEKSWVCPECLIVLQAESSETRSQAMKKISLGMLCDLLKHAVERMMDLNGVEPFIRPVDRVVFPQYDKYVVHPMDLSLMQTNIGEGLYGSTEAFLADVQWILHNSIIFNTLQSKLTAAARALVRSCRAEMAEIEACPECYAAAHARRPTWFTDVCTTPHVLLWAKLKGFPYWPAKGMSVNCAGHVDVRFFGAHDRAWVPAKDCFLYSEKDPNNFRSKRQDIIDSMQEAEQHIRNISRKYGQFVYPPFKTQFDPTKLTQQLKLMIPSFEGEARAPVKEKATSSPAAAKEKRSSNSKSSKSSYNDGDTSGTEEANENYQLTADGVLSRKMADGAEIAREDEESPSSEKIEVSIDVETVSKASDFSTSNTVNQHSQSTKSDQTSRKRRRSELEEAVITIMDTSTNPPEAKKKKDNKQEKKKTDKEPTSKEVPTKSDSDEIKNVEAKKDLLSKDDDSSSSSKSETEKEKQRVTPIRIALVPKDKKHNLRTVTVKEAVAKIITPTKDNDKEKESDKTTPLRQKASRAEKTEKTPKEDKVSKAEKRRNSRNNRSLTSTPKPDKLIRSSIEKKAEKNDETKDKVKENNKDSKDKTKENGADSKEKGSDGEKSKKDKVNSPKPAVAEPSTSVKDRLQFDDDTTLAVIARKSKTVVVSNNSCGLTISNVRSLAVNAENPNSTSNSTSTNGKSSEFGKDSNTDVSVFTHTTTESVKSMKDVATKLQKLRNDTEPIIGRVGVRAFARMTSPDTSSKKTDDVQVEIKAEPIDVDDADRQVEKLNLMNAFRLRPVNPIQSPTSSNLREVRINKVLVATATAPVVNKKTVGKVNEVRPRAKKTFPQPKKPEDGQLNSKNSMVYIPIQPAMTQAPVRPTRVVSGSTCSPLAKTTAANSQVNTVTTPVMQVSSISTTSTTSTTAMPGVHTVPLMTSVNGQWMFSFQPVMSVGAIENSPSPPILNGVSDRGVLPSVATQSGQQATSSANNNLTTILPLAKTTGDTSAPGEPPRLQQRPTSMLLNPLDANFPIANMPPPSTAGPITAKLNQNAVKLTDFFRTLLEDTLEKLDDPTTQLTMLKLQLEQAKWKHQAEVDEIKHNHELTLAEIRALFEKERLRAVAEARRSSQVELEAAVKAAKSKQWCANCNQEAQFYCCWNTSYCDYPCQRAHWAQHFNVCAQQRPDGSSNGEPPNPSESRLQPQPEVPKSSAPALTVGSKLTATRVYAQDSTPSTQKSIIVGMVEESGAPAMKCVGTYKPTPTQSMSPIILNKQIMNNEESANKKVVSSGGYLIVGGGGNNAAVVTPARRTHTIQYFT